MRLLLHSICATVICGASPSLFADEIVIDQCPKGHTQATVDITLAVSANEEGCPLLEDKKLRKLVDKFEVGSTYNSSNCLSGEILGGSTIWLEGENEPIQVLGASESAQRKFAEAVKVGDDDGLLIVGFPPGAFQPAFASGAATTIVSLSGDSLQLDLVLADRFTVDFSDGVDTEEFLIIGSEGDFKSVKGRLLGSAFSQLPDETFFDVSGTICVK